MADSSPDERFETGHAVYQRPRRRAWHRQFFHDHPGYVHGDRDAYAGDKVKVWCKQCFAQCLEEERERLAPVERERLDETALKRQLWGPQPSGSRTWWIQNRTANCLVHLRDCDLQDIQVRTEAEARHRPPPHQRRRSPDQGDTVFGDRASPVNEGHGPSSITAVAEQHPSGHLPYNDPSVSSSPQLQATATIPPIYHSVAHHARELGTYSIPPGLQAWMPDWNTLVAPTDYPDAAHLARQQGWAGPARASGEVLAAAVPHDESVMMRETAPPQAGPSVRSSALAPLPEDPTHVWYDNGSYPWHGSHGGS